MKTIMLTILLMITGQVILAQNTTDNLLLSKLQPKAEKPLHGISIYIENSKTGEVYENAVGKHLDGDAITANDAFKIASSTKTFVATVILQLAEEGKLRLNKRASKYINIDSLLLFKGKDYTKKITVRQLLEHRTGLANVFTDKRDEFAALLFQNPMKQHTPLSLVEMFCDLDLPEAAHFKPGKGWCYSDMNYMLLGLIIEKIEQKTLAEVIRERILEPLQMKATYFEFYEAEIKNQKRVPQFVTQYDFNAINTSFDWAGGGLVSTHHDLAKFMKGLFSRKLISEKSLTMMTNVKPTASNALPYGFGVYQSEYNGQKFYGHYGFYGTYIGYCPISKTVISYCFGQSQLAFNKDQIAQEILVEFQKKIK